MKRLTNILALAVIIIGFFGVFNVYAQESINVDFEGEKKVKNTLLGVSPEEDNLVTNNTNQFQGALTTATATLLPEIFEGFEEVQAMDDVSPMTKNGVISTLDNSMNTLYTSTPTINLYAHLAQEWVPGYDKTTSGIYAAQQSGYEELMDSGIAGIWANIRNISYVFFILVMLVAGFMIMFRHKLGGQTLVTLGNALPNVILSLILVTFSFAIAGLIIDLGGVLMVVIQDILGLNDYVSTHSLWSLMGVFFHGTGRVLGIVGTGGAALAATIIGVKGVLAASAVGAAATNPAGWFILGGVGIVALLLILLVVGIVFVGSVMVLITLIKAYVGILLNVILAPLQLAAGAMPGNQAMVKNWFNNLLRNVMVFPVVFFLINLPLAIADTSNLNLGFPEKLVYMDSIPDANGMDGLAALFIFLLQIVIFFYAAQVPKYLEAIFPPATPKAIQEGMSAAKGGLSKIPLVGGIFK
jgi:hypothetical protein